MKQKKLTNDETLKLVYTIFDKLKNATDTECVDLIVDEEPLIRSNKMDISIYPKIEFKITKDEVEELKNQGLVSQENEISDAVDKLSPIAKLLYSVVWKNGDLKKVKHIIQGIVSNEKDEKEEALVFYQFGKYLTQEKGEPIIDQHILRAFGLYLSLLENNINKIDYLRSISVITKKEKDLIARYKEWLSSDELNPELKINSSYTYHIDKVLFALGKTIKLKNSKFPA